ncbi:chemotaxis protein CheC [Thermococcus zilligii]|uniref:chemotaxis protein CheC n=1 Tax=Thermococcus zilligii TaxID=54076 RepID=UPI00029A1FA5|nr:chemotaxis protein CheC [Thermococcus zilligii]
MESAGNLSLLFKAMFKDVLNRIDPSGKLRLSSVRVVPSFVLVQRGILEGVNLVCFTLGDPPEAIVAFRFDYSRAWEDILKSNIDVLHSADPMAIINSLLKEVGNIIVGPLSTRLSKVLGKETLPSVPFAVGSVEDLEKLLRMMGEKVLPVFEGTISDGHLGSIEVCVIPSRHLLHELNSNPEVRGRVRWYIKKIRGEGR